jgi:hypothetical protein
MIIQSVGRTTHNLTFDYLTYETACKYIWHCKTKNGIHWFYTLVDSKELSLNSILFGTTRNQIVVHKNGDTLDFNLSNIEILTRQEYAHKYIASTMKKKSKYNNVTWDSTANKWKVRFIKAGQVAYERYLDNEGDAATVADYKSLELYSSKSSINLPDMSYKELTEAYNKIVDKYGDTRVEIKSKSLQGVGRVKGTSKYVGVYLDKRRNKWCASVKFKGEKHWCGSYVDEVDAARAYNKKALELYGEGVKLNVV